MDINMRDMDGLVATALIAKESPDSQIIIVSMQNESSYMQQAMVAGARSFLSKPVSIDELYATIRSVYERRRPKTHRPDEREPIHLPEAHVIVVYAPQAGAGTTTVATNLAASLMRDDTRVLLIDCNLYFGDVGIFLNVREKETIADLSDISDDVETEIINNVLATHDSGLKVLLAPSSPQEADAITTPQILALIKQLRPNFDFIVIDTATFLDEINLALFDLAGQILLIRTPTLPAVKNVHNILNLLAAFHIDANKVQVVLNRVNIEFEKAKITPTMQSIEHNLQRKVFASIPMDERRVLSAINRGVTVVAKDRNLSPAKELIALAEAVRENFIDIEQSVP
jgi:pilus assembly protein CpaE